MNSVVNTSDVLCEVFAFQGDFDTCGGDFAKYDVEPVGGDEVLYSSDIHTAVRAFEDTPDCMDPGPCS